MAKEDWPKVRQMLVAFNASCGLVAQRARYMCDAEEAPSRDELHALLYLMGSWDKRREELREYLKQGTRYPQ